ncbi:site-specific integrase [Robertkochia flava]|uniref:site-specific integrase n=1 Tax=Robertkochia flava TaxID=3447986 RepID=UPI001CCE534E|nr:site-specific integrase [Robertkochia marina]
MSSIKPILRKKRNARGLFPVAIRITKDRKSSYIYTGQYIEQKHWDEELGVVKKSHPNSRRLNHLIVKRIAEINDKLLEAEIAKAKVSAGAVRKSVRGEDKLGFFEVAKMHLDQLKRDEKFRQYENQKGRVEKFLTFIGRNKLSFDDIDVALLRKFQSHLVVTEGRKPRTAINYLILIRKIYNQGITMGMASRALYPFGKGKISIKIPESQKIGLTMDEIRILESAEGLTPAQVRALDVWLTSFYFAGIRVSDVLQLRWSDFKDGRLYYRMDKNKKLVSLKIPVKAEKILGKYRSGKSSRNALLFDYLQEADLHHSRTRLTRIRTSTRTINRRLKTIADKLEIDKKLTMHIARHSFGNISGDKIPIQMLQKLYRHSSITTTIAYQASFMQKEADDALDKVVNF